MIEQNPKGGEVFAAMIEGVTAIVKPVPHAPIVADVVVPPQVDGTRANPIVIPGDGTMDDPIVIE